MKECTIFVALAAYCEPELELTIKDCIAKSSKPDNLRFGICLQYDAGGEKEIQADCIDHLITDKRIRVIKFDHRESKGGCWARNLVQTMYAEEDYTIQVDAHTRFVEGWDQTLINMVQRFPSEKPLITGFPPLYFRHDEVDSYTCLDWRGYTNTTVMEQWSPDGWIHHPTHDIKENFQSPRYTRFLSGAFVFTSGEWNKTIMQDPEHYYSGEEFALTLRSYTHGYDLFTPDEIVVWHRCHPEANRKHFSDFENEISQKHHNKAMERLNLLMKGDPAGELGRFGLGTTRNLEDFYNFSGLDCENFEAHPDAIAGVPPNPQTIKR